MHYSYSLIFSSAGKPLTNINNDGKIFQQLYSRHAVCKVLCILKLLPYNYSNCFPEFKK